MNPETETTKEKVFEALNGIDQKLYPEMSMQQLLDVLVSSSPFSGHLV